MVRSRSSGAPWTAAAKSVTSAAARSASCFADPFLVADERDVGDGGLAFTVKDRPVRQDVL